MEEKILAEAQAEIEEERGEEHATGTATEGEHRA